MKTCSILMAFCLVLPFLLVMVSVATAATDPSKPQLDALVSPTDRDTSQIAPLEFSTRSQDYREIGRRAMEDAPQVIRDGTDMQRIQWLYQRYLKGMNDNHVPNNDNQLSRLYYTFVKLSPTRYTCNWHSDALENLFQGAGINNRYVGTMVARKLISEVPALGTMIDSNANHIIIYVGDPNTGEIRYFDPQGGAYRNGGDFNKLLDSEDALGIPLDRMRQILHDNRYLVVSDEGNADRNVNELTYIENINQLPSIANMLRLISPGNTQQPPFPEPEQTTDPTRIKPSCPPNTTTYDERTGMCLPNEPCKGNKIWNDEKYVCECKWNEKLDESGNCIPIPCTGGKVWNTDSRNCECKEGYSEDGSGNCVKTCSDGSLPDPGSGECPVGLSACSGMIQGLSSIEIFGVVVNYDAGDRLYHAVKDGDTIVFDPCTFIIRDETTGEERQVSESDILYPQNEPPIVTPILPPIVPIPVTPTITPTITPIITPTVTPIITPTVTPSPTNILPVDPVFGPMHGDGCYYRDGKPILCSCWMECPECVPCSAAYRKEQNIIVPDDCDTGSYWKDGVCYPDTVINQVAKETSTVSPTPPSPTCSDGSVPDPDTGECPVATTDTPVVSIRGITFTYHPEDGEYHGTFQEESGEVHELRFDAKSLFVHCITCGSEEYISESEVMKIT